METVASSTNAPSTQNTPVKKAQTISWDQIGAKAGADYRGNGLSVTATATGARLHCIFQRMDGEVTGEGLWLVSTITNQPEDRFRVLATGIGRRSLSPQGTVRVNGQTVSFTRVGLVEEYSVGMDGVQQDFMVTEKPADDGQLRVRLAVAGARVKPMAYGAQLVLEKSGRKIAYSRLHVTDANGKKLPARIEVEQKSEIKNPSEMSLAIVVDDANAVYPVRIDPTFSDANWISMGSVNGTDGNVLAAVVDSSGNLYIGGRFAVVGNIVANNIAEWNGSSWSALGEGVNANVLALALSGTNLYVGGIFTTAINSENSTVPANYIALWNGSRWSALGSGVNGQVDALAVSGGKLYAGGLFLTAGGNAANHIAQWNGSNWSALGSGLNLYVYALAVSGNTLYVGGEFSTAGGNTANYIAQWNGNNWAPVGSGVSGVVYALAVSGNTLYAGGAFATAGGNAASCIAQWNGSIWAPLGSGISGQYSTDVYALAVSGGSLYVGGIFTTAGGNAASNVAQWNGSNWLALGSGTDDEVSALAVSGGLVFVGGWFPSAGGNPVGHIAQWDGNNWSALWLGTGGGYSPSLYAVAAAGGTLYAGGSFTMAGGNAANYIAQWNGSSWATLGSGMNAPVLALATSGTRLYAGGTFTTAGGNSASHIAEWNGSSWSALGSGVNSNIFALATVGKGVYAGGNFTNAGGNTANFVAQWNGVSWSALGSGLNNNVSVLFLSGTNLYVGGNFTTAGGSTASHIAQWNGSSWSALGSGVNNNVLALAGAGTNLYAAGSFTTAGGNTASHIAQWNGTSWSALGSGMNNAVAALSVSGGVLYAGGNFTTAGGDAANYIAQWNGNSWSALGSGMNSTVDTLMVSGGVLYAGGNFTVAGGNPSANAAKAMIGPPTILTQPQNTNSMAGGNASFAVGAGGEQPFSYQWFKNGNELSNSGNASGATSGLMLLTNVSVNDPGYYLVVVSNYIGSTTSTLASLTVSNLPLVLHKDLGSLGYISNQFWLTVTGPAGSNVVFSASTNLQTWVPIATNPLSLGSLNFTDALATNYPKRFYRIQISP